MAGLGLGGEGRGGRIGQPPGEYFGGVHRLGEVHRSPRNADDNRFCCQKIVEFVGGIVLDHGVLSTMKMIDGRNYI